MSEQAEAKKTPAQNPVKPLATFHAESGAKIEVLPDLTLNFVDFPEDAGEARKALTDIVRHALPLQVALMQTQQTVEQAISLDMLGTIKLVTVSNPKEVAEGLQFKQRMISVAQNYGQLLQKMQPAKDE